MKGIVFTEFVEMVEEKFGLLMVDTLFEKTTLASGGAYTAVGTYPHTELVALVVSLSGETDISTSALVRTFGQHMAGRFAALYPAFFEVPNTFTFLESVDQHIHVEVKKLYPAAELPRILCERDGEHLEVIYESQRGLANFAQGLIEGSLAHFHETADIERTDLDGGSGKRVRFYLRLTS